MTGPEHYREAARLAAIAQRHVTRNGDEQRIAEVTAGVAHVHALLALAAATALNQDTHSDDRSAWVATASEYTKRFTGSPLDGHDLRIPGVAS